MVIDKFEKLIFATINDKLTYRIEIYMSINIEIHLY